MHGSDDQRAAARQAAELMAMDLTRVSGLLEEVGTLWRRAGFYPRPSAPIAPASLQTMARNLAEVLHLVPDTDSKEHPALAFAAVAQLAALEGNAARSAALTADRHLGDAGLWAGVEGALLHAGEQLWSLITCLVNIGEPRPAEGRAAAQVAAATGGRPSGRPAAGPAEARRALAMQRAAIDALPEADLRRLLSLIGGLDPEALQRAAVTYTETFCAVTEMEGSVAALRPIARAAPADHLHDPAPR
jgi:hypothetical protein